MSSGGRERSRQRELIDRYINAYNAFDIEGMLALVSQDVRFENYSGDQLTASANGVDEFRHLAERAKSVFSEREQRVTLLEVNQDFAVAEIAFRGRLAADIPGGPVAGTVLELQGNSQFSFRDGRITKIVDRS
jgi:steroid delta-isomerase-like uncharacterized protein